MIDRGAIFAGWVGVGMALIIVIGLELIIAVQTLVFLVAPLGGILIGYFANARSERRRPVWRVLVNALYAGVVSGISLALLYGGLRLLFVYADSGYPDFNVAGRPACETGPACTYARYVAAGRGEELARFGVGDASTFERYVVSQQVYGGLTLLALSTGGAIVGGGLYAVSGGDRDREAYAT